jgi:hypothetical protein
MSLSARPLAWRKWAGRFLLAALLLYLTLYFRGTVEDLFRLGCF